jgi:hypothetical protein
VLPKGTLYRLHFFVFVFTLPLRVRDIAPTVGAAVFVTKKKCNPFSVLILFILLVFFKLLEEKEEACKKKTEDPVRTTRLSLKRYCSLDRVCLASPSPYPTSVAPPYIYIYMGWGRGEGSEEDG